MSLKRFDGYLALRLVPYVTVAAGLFLLHRAWAALLGYHAGMLIVFFQTRAWQRFERFKPANSLTWILGLSFLSILVGVWIYFKWPILTDTEVTSSYLHSLGLNNLSWPWFMAYFALVNPWMEELYWRDLLGSRLSHPVLDDAWFGAYHLLILFPFVGWQWQIIALIALIGAAWLWRQSIRLTGSLFAPAVAHLLADFSILFAAFLRSSF